mgnify:CR=1 FL=1
MKKQTINLVRLGAFVLISTTCLILGLYYIGSNKNIFSPSITVVTEFGQVSGLVPGNNVRFNGINVGTVTEIYPVSDTSIRVEFTINRKSAPFISQTAVVSIGTDGLLGNKLINIAPGQVKGRQVKEGDMLAARDPLDVDNAMRTLALTNDNLMQITDNLKGMSENFGDNSLIALLSDTALARDVRAAVVTFHVTGNNTAVLTGDLRSMIKDVRSGKGTFGSLLTDTTLQYQLRQTIVNMESISDSVMFISGDFRAFSSKLKNNQGTLGMLLNDTGFVYNLNQSMENLKRGSGNFDQNMEALKHTWPFRKYFRKQKAKTAK